MITQEEFTALAQLLQRTPMSAAEAQWTQAFLLRLQAQLGQRARARSEAQRSKQQGTGKGEPANERDDGLPTDET